MSLRQQAFNASIWSAIDAFSRHGLRFVLSLILARLLTPEDFGTVALLGVFLALAGTFIDSGFSLALIQRQSPTPEEISSVFYFNLIVSGVVAGLLSLAAPQIAAFYDSPLLRPLTYLLALSLVIGAFGTVPSALFSKALDFRRPCVISLISSGISGVVAIILAASGFGVWSLALQSLVGTILSTILLWQLSPWRPLRTFSPLALRSLLGFSTFVLLSSILDNVSARLSTLVIGKLYSPADLGLFNRAETASQLPTNLLSAIPSRIAFPLFSAAKNDRHLLRAGLRKSLAISMLVNVPVMIGISATARPLIHCLYGAKWEAAAPYLSILALAGIFWPTHLLNLNVLGAQGLARQAFVLEVMKKAIGLLALAVASCFGIEAIAWSSVALALVSLPINCHYSRRHLQYGMTAQLRDLAPCLVAASLMGCVVTLAAHLASAPLLQLVIQVAVGVASYVALCEIFRVPEYADARRLLWQKLRQLKGHRASGLRPPNGL